MSNLILILPFHMALAVTDESGIAAVHRLCRAAQHTPRQLLQTSDLVWSATSISNRHALLLQWLANEARS